MRAYVFLLLTILALCSAQQANPAIKIVSNITDLNKWFERHLNVLSYIDLPLPPQEWDVLGVGIFKADHLRVRNVSAKGIKVEPIGENRLRISVIKSTFVADYHTRVGLIPSTGEVTFTDNSVVLVMHIDGDRDGTPVVELESLKISLGSFKLRILLGHSLWTIINTAIPIIKGLIEKEIPVVAVPLTNKIIRDQMKAFNVPFVAVDPAKRMAMDISFFSRPIFTQQLVQIEIRGLPHVDGKAFKCPLPYGKPLVGKNDVSVYVDGGFMNCATAAAAQADVLNEFLDMLAGLPTPVSEPIAVTVRLNAQETVLKMREGGMAGSFAAQVGLYRSLHATGAPWLSLALRGSTSLTLSFEGTNFTAVTVRGEIANLDNSLSIMSFNGDQRGLSTDLKALAKPLSMLDTYLNHRFHETIVIPYPPELAVVPRAANELFETLNLRFVNGGFYVGIDYRV